MGTIGVKWNAVSMRNESMHDHEHYMGRLLACTKDFVWCACVRTTCLFFIFGVLF